MPYALTFTGLLMIITGINNTYGQLGAQLKSDFTGDKSFVLYIAALGSVGAIGYIPSMRRFSHMFMALILVSLVLSNKGFFQNFSAALKLAPVAPSAPAVPAGQAGIDTVKSAGAPATPTPATTPKGARTFGDLVSGFFNNFVTSPAH